MPPGSPRGNLALERARRLADCRPLTDQATSASGGRARFSERTAWARNLAAPLRDFLSTETGGAVALLAATVAALIWANSPWPHSYESVWTTDALDPPRRLGHLARTCATGSTTG